MPASSPSMGIAPLQADRGQALPLRPRRGQATGSERCFCPQAAFLLAPCPQLSARLRATAPAGGCPL
ncbi:hypothetical protein B296_00056787 [Ensete ventricosum]|uniref:Uncharacterized protein n=1 Tax=Ensete ventricosum TaxID=4639 RepID=A0A426WYY3_ENSVE|nr:hypothetical protein B296_00056787 [Ensete ventricosum]